MVVFLIYKWGNGGRNKIGIQGGFAAIFFCLGCALIKGYFSLEGEALDLPNIDRHLKIFELEEQN